MENKESKGEMFGFLSHEFTFRGAQRKKIYPYIVCPFLLKQTRGGDIFPSFSSYLFFPRKCKFLSPYQKMLMSQFVCFPACPQPLKWELKQKPGLSPPRGGFNLDDPNQQIVAEDIFDEYGGNIFFPWPVVAQVKFFYSVLCILDPNALFDVQDFLLRIMYLICWPAYQANQIRKRSPVRASTKSGLHQLDQIYVIKKKLLHLRMMMIEEEH